MKFPIFNNAKATIKGSSKYPNIRGSVYFKQTRDGVIVTAKIYGLPYSKKKCDYKILGFHIHEGKSCTGNKTDEFANAKTHYNPNNCNHPNHAGDLPPLFSNNGYAYMSVLNDRFKVKDIVGKTVIIHDMPDDFKSQPSGDSGTKIACGVIEK